MGDQALVDLEVGLRSGTSVTVASVKAENAYLKRRLLDLEHAVRELKARLGEAMGQELPDVAPSDTSLADRVTELEQQLFEARETIRDREEELEAARAVNQSLMRAQNQEPR
jgi:chromosome segregation ATPase